MRFSDSITCVLLAVLLMGFTNRTEAQTREQLSSQSQWMNSWASWMNAHSNAVSRTNVCVQVAEAQAKLITANASMVSAVANANKANAEALQTLEQVRSTALDNELKKAETFYGKKALYENHRNLAKTRPRPTEEDVRRYSRASAPDRLTPNEYDSLRNEIHWPSLLKRDEFSAHREQITQLFSRRLDYYDEYQNKDVQQEVQGAIEKMKADLCSLVREVPLTQYTRARKFVRNLAYESQFPPRIDGLAAN